MPKAEQNATTSRTVRAPDPNGAPPIPHARRRELLGSFASMLLLVLSEAGASKVVELDGELIAACAEFGRLDDAYAVACRAEDCAPDGPEKDALSDQLYVLGDEQRGIYDALCDMPARTPEGLRARAQACSARFQNRTTARRLNTGISLPGRSCAMCWGRRVSGATRPRWCLSGEETGF